MHAWGLCAWRQHAWQMAPEANSEAAPTPTHLGQDQRLKFSTLAQESGMMMSTAAAIWMRGKGGGSLFLFKEDVMGRMRGLCSNGSGVSRTMGMHDEGSVQHRVGPLVQQWGRSEPSDREDLCSGMLMTCRY